MNTLYLRDSNNPVGMLGIALLLLLSVPAGAEDARQLAIPGVYVDRGSFALAEALGEIGDRGVAWYGRPAAPEHEPPSEADFEYEAEVKIDRVITYYVFVGSHSEELMYNDLVDQGELFQEFSDRVKACFNRQHIFKPQSSRKASKEIFIIGIGKLDS